MINLLTTFDHVKMKTKESIFNQPFRFIGIHSFVSEVEQLGGGISILFILIQFSQLSLFNRQEEHFRKSQIEKHTILVRAEFSSIS